MFHNKAVKTRFFQGSITLNNSLTGITQMSTLAFRLLRDQGSVTGFLATLETRDPASLVAVHYAHIATSLRLSRPGRRRISFATLILCSTF
jgi:hypothetical protein